MSEETKTFIEREKKFSNADFEKKIPSLTFLAGDQVGRRIMLADDRITLGRAPEATILVRDTHVSRMHLAVEFEPQKGHYVIRDLGSSNGSFLNGSHITQAVLTDSDKILIGNTILRFGWSDAFDLKYQTEIENLINIDELTGLIVKRRFDEELNRYIAVARSQGTELVMIMIDIDGVKRINDTHGHAYGAYTIAQTGRLIKSATEQKGLASRFGGDEFMVFIPDATLDEAYQRAEALRHQIETDPFEKDGIVLKPTVSIGISEFKPDDTVISLFKRTDDALYLAKRTGRNKVSVVR
jgi:two-component system, cell cycle response regulator